VDPGADERLRSCRVGPQVLIGGAAKGPLAGLEFVAKDVFDVAGQRTGAGNPTFLSEAERATGSAAAVQALVRAGASCVGKSHTDELAFSLSGCNAHYGTPLNSGAPRCTPGGSSSGSAAAVAGHLVPFALGTDTGGSIRVPASYCGLVGMRPTHGRISTAGMVPLARSFDTVGWLAASAELARRVGDVLLPGDESVAPERLALLDEAQAAVPEGVRAAVAEAAQALASRTGLPLTTVRLPAGDLDEWLTTFRTIQTAEAHAAHGRWIVAHPGAVTPDISERFDSGAAVTTAVLADARAHRAGLRHALVHLLSSPPTALVIPSAAGSATALDAAARHVAAVRAATLRLTCIAGIGGAPAVSLPLATVNALPLGICLVATPRSDRSLLELASEAAG
jgi:Asp-tRNA(Asn)/Glu-tRNA(Gln) amidotransferase A subunit family amidase